MIVGVKVRLGYQMVGDDPEPALRLARQASEELGLPLMVHIIDMRRPISWLLRYLGEGDIVTHCFHANEGGILDPDGRLHPAVARARARGVLFDVGHGAGSFAYSGGEGRLRPGLPAGHGIERPARAQRGRTRVRPGHHAVEAAALRDEPGRGDHGGDGRARRPPSGAAARSARWRPGSVADLTGFELRAGGWLLPDGAGRSEVVETLVVPRLVVRAGQVHRLEPVIRGAVP